MSSLMKLYSIKEMRMGCVCVVFWIVVYSPALYSTLLLVLSAYVTHLQYILVDFVCKVCTPYYDVCVYGLVV